MCAWLPMHLYGSLCIYACKRKKLRENEPSGVWKYVGVSYKTNEKDESVMRQLIPSSCCWRTINNLSLSWLLCCYISIEKHLYIKFWTCWIVVHSVFAHINKILCGQLYLYRDTWEVRKWWDNDIMTGVSKGKHPKHLIYTWLAIMFTTTWCWVWSVWWWPLLWFILRATLPSISKSLRDFTWKHKCQQSQWGDTVGPQNVMAVHLIAISIFQPGPKTTDRPILPPPILYLNLNKPLNMPLLNLKF